MIVQQTFNHIQETCVPEPWCAPIFSRSESRVQLQTAAGYVSCICDNNNMCNSLNFLIARPITVIVCHLTYFTTHSDSGESSSFHLYSCIS